MTTALRKRRAFRRHDLPVRDVLGRVGATVIGANETKSVLTRATGFMDAYDYTLNPYSGCSFGCTYCYAAFFSRGTDLRDDWGNWAHVKTNLADELYRKFVRNPQLVDDRLVYMSSVTDPYQPVERRVELTRRVMQLFAGEIELLKEGGRSQGSFALAEASPLYGVERLGCEGDDFVVEYLRHYESVRDGLRSRLVDEAGCTLAEGKDGFAPPF